MDGYLLVFGKQLVVIVTRFHFNMKTERCLRLSPKPRIEP